jgi:hypothetical protein
MIEEFDGHGRPFVVGMNGSSGGFFIPLQILLDPSDLAQTILPAAPESDEAQGAGLFSPIEAPRASVSVLRPFEPGALVEHAPTSIDSIAASLFGWDAPTSSAVAAPPAALIDYDWATPSFGLFGTPLVDPTPDFLFGYF